MLSWALSQLRKREEIMHVEILTGIFSLIASLVGTFGVF